MGEGLTGRTVGVGDGGHPMFPKGVILLTQHWDAGEWGDTLEPLKEIPLCQPPGGLSSSLIQWGPPR